MCRVFSLLRTKEKYMQAIASKINFELKVIYDLSILFMRVLSWLRTNAGGVPNTCKSNAFSFTVACYTGRK